MKKPGMVRIIGGTLKRSKLPVLDKPGLRPTPDRVRETVFNWIAPRLPGAQVLDCFAGTGAFGFEALSPGAAYVTFIEHERETAAAIRSAIDRFGCGERATVIITSVENVLSQHVPNADVIFADPPFNQGLSQAFCTWIQGQLQPDSLLILEAERDTTLDFTGFEVLKFLHAGADSMYVLAQDGP